MRQLIVIAAIFILDISTIFCQVLDQNYGINGTFIIDKYEDPGLDLFPLLQEDGSMYLIGIPAQSFMNSGVYLTRITPEGQVDIDFGVDGFVEYDLGQEFTFISDVIQLDNGNILIGGLSFQNAWMLMYDTEGNLVNDFGADGFVDTNLAGDVNRIFLAQDGDKIMAVHKESINGSAVLATSRFNSDGNFDITYGVNGTMKYGDFGFVNALNDVEMIKDADGNWEGAYLSVFRLNGEEVSFVTHLLADGSIDPNFAEDGVYRMANGNSIRTMALDFNGDVVLSTVMNDTYQVYKLDADGNPLEAFGDEGVYTNNLSLSINNSVNIIPTINEELIHLFTVDEPALYKPLLIKHEPDGTQNEEIGEVIYDQMSVLALDMRHQDNGDIYVLGMSIGEMVDIEYPTIIKYTSDITEVEDLIPLDISIIPNPSSNGHWIMNGELKDIRSAYLYNMSGKLICPLEIAGDRLQTDLSLLNGMYIIQVIAENGKSVKIKTTIIQ